MKYWHPKSPYPQSLSLLCLPASYAHRSRAPPHRCSCRACGAGRKPPHHCSLSPPSEPSSSLAHLRLRVAGDSSRLVEVLPLSAPLMFSFSLSSSVSCCCCYSWLLLVVLLLLLWVVSRRKTAGTLSMVSCCCGLASPALRHHSPKFNSHPMLCFRPCSTWAEVHTSCLFFFKFQNSWLVIQAQVVICHCCYWMCYF